MPGPFAGGAGRAGGARAGSGAGGAGGGSAIFSGLDRAHAGRARAGPGWRREGTGRGPGGSVAGRGRWRAGSGLTAGRSSLLAAPAGFLISVFHGEQGRAAPALAGRTGRAFTGPAGGGAGCPRPVSPGRDRVSSGWAGLAGAAAGQSRRRAALARTVHGSVRMMPFYVLALMWLLTWLGSDRAWGGLARR